MLNLNTPSQQERDYPSPDPASMVFEFAPGECLHQNIYILIFRKNLLKQHDLPLQTISDMMILDINMFRSIMKHRINREFNATLIITIYLIRIYAGTQ